MVENLRKRKSRGEPPPSRLPELERLLLETSAAYKEITIVIDALDECTEQSRKELLTCVLKLPKVSKDTIKLFLTSRVDEDIRKNLTNIPSISLEDEVENVATDIRSYVFSKFEHGSNLMYFPRELKEEIYATFASSQLRYFSPRNTSVFSMACTFKFTDWLSFTYFV